MIIVTRYVYIEHNYKPEKSYMIRVGFRVSSLMITGQTSESLNQHKYGHYFMCRYLHHQGLV